MTPKDFLNSFSRDVEAGVKVMSERDESEDPCFVDDSKQLEE